LDGNWRALSAIYGGFVAKVPGVISRRQRKAECQATVGLIPGLNLARGLLDISEDSVVVAWYSTPPVSSTMEQIEELNG